MASERTKAALAERIRRKKAWERRYRRAVMVEEAKAVVEKAETLAVAAASWVIALGEAW